VRDLVPPALIAAAVIVWATGALDRPGWEGAGDGLAIGAAICAPIWLMSLLRKARRRDDRRNR
jgi:hypothetical protein